MPPEFNPNTLQKYIITKISKAVVEEDLALDTKKLENSNDSINFARIKTDRLSLLLGQAKSIGIPRYNVLRTILDVTKEQERKATLKIWYASNGGISEEIIKRLSNDFKLDCDF